MSTLPANLIAGRWVPIPGESLRSTNPAHPQRCVYACGPVPAHVDDAVAAARSALGPWAALPAERRHAVLRRFASIIKQRADALAGLLCDEVGKVLWECRGEVASVVNKVEITLDPAPEGGMHRVTPASIALSATRQGRTIFKPHGVMAVVGPFNFPAHLPNGHIVPALAMGNTVVFKPSDKAPAVGQMLAQAFDDALRQELGNGYIPGVVNLVQGGADVASRLVGHDGIDAVAFTGSWPVGRRILEANLDRPGRIIALELGGNNPAIVMDDADLRSAAIELVRCAFNTTGQRCTCTRRLIVHEKVAARLVSAVCKAASNLIIGDPRAPHPVFTGPIISQAARDAVLDFQARAADAGGEVLMPCRPMDNPGGGWFITPGVMRVDRFEPTEPPRAADLRPGSDVEVFGPLLRFTTVNSLDEAIAQANATRYGLAASIFTANPDHAERFVAECRAGCLNVNTGTAGASSKLPFGGLGLSGNHRPAGAFALDYCAYPAASMVETSPAAGATIPEGMRFDDGWLR
ncbi:MAG: aldehyde dehydrogenase family protein [Phycisphaeraceae bacterium]|nr:aldehyde dehydrogenase family protein [Phycisphaeraceae bacterium]